MVEATVIAVTPGGEPAEAPAADAAVTITSGTAEQTRRHDATEHLTHLPSARYVLYRCRVPLQM
jgi:hypothetical protein